MNGYRVYLRRDRELCREMFRSDDRQSAIDFLHRAIKMSTDSGEPLQGWISGPADLVTRHCEEVAHMVTPNEPRKPANGVWR